MYFSRVAQFAQFSPRHALTRPGRQDPLAQSLRVLVVDDDPAVRDTVQAFLESRGCEVVAADDGVEGLEAVSHGEFDAVISDVRMPRRDGVWLWHEALALRPGLQGQFLFISGVPMTADGGAENERFLLKPFTMPQLWTELTGITDP